MDQATFNTLMDELDRKNPVPINNFYSAERIAAIAESAKTLKVVGAMPEPTRAQQAEYYRLYKDIEALFLAQRVRQYCPISRLIHAEVVRRMNIKDASCTP